MTAKYSVHEIRILLALNKGQMTKSAFTRRFHGLPLNDRYKFLENLIKDGLVKSEERPTPNAKHIPIYYFLSDAGKKWVTEYLNQL